MMIKHIASICLNPFPGFLSKTFDVGQSDNFVSQQAAKRLDGHDNPRII